MQQLEIEFKEYKVGTIGEEINWMEEKLGEEACWSGGKEEMESYKAIERQRNNLL